MHGMSIPPIVSNPELICLLFLVICSNSLHPDSIWQETIQNSCALQAPPKKTYKLHEEQQIIPAIPSLPGEEYWYSYEKQRTLNFKTWIHKAIKNRYNVTWIHNKKNNQPRKTRTILSMERILPQLRGSLAHYLQGFVHPSWWAGFLNYQQYHESLVLDRRYYENTGENESDSCDDGTATRFYENWFSGGLKVQRWTSLRYWITFLLDQIRPVTLLLYMIIYIYVYFYIHILFILYII